MIAAVVIALLAGAPTASAPLTPSNKWVVDYRDMSCVLSRQFGEGQGEVTVGWRALPLADEVELLVGTRSRSMEGIRGRLVAQLSGGAREVADFSSYATTIAGQRMTRAMLPSAMFANLPEATTLTITPQELPPVSVVIPGAAKAFDALDACTRDTVKQWGIDPAELAFRDKAEAASDDSSDSGPKAESPAQWITPDDYPVEALRAGAQGTSVLLWTVGVDGRVHDCKAVIPSGFEPLDKAGCKAITARGRYVPAHDASGQPVAVHSTRKIVWMLPNYWRKARGKEPE